MSCGDLSGYACGVMALVIAAIPLTLSLGVGLYIIARKQVKWKREREERD